MAAFVMVDGIGGNDSFTKILMHMEGSNGGTVFTDSNFGGSAHTWTASTATTSTSAKEFGSTSMFGNTGYIDTPDHADYTLGSVDWTIDFWFNRNSNTGLERLFGQGNSTNTTATTPIIGTFNAGNTISVSASNGAAFSTITTAAAFNDSTWRHIAFVRSANDFTLYVGGISAGTFNAAITLPDSANKWAIGRQGENTSSPLKGFIDEFRLSVGIARWTANFTPPTSAYD